MNKDQRRLITVRLNSDESRGSVASLFARSGISQLFDGRSAEQGDQRQLLPGQLFKLSEESNREQGGAAEGEEIVMDANALQVQ